MLARSKRSRALWTGGGRRQLNNFNILPFHVASTSPPDTHTFTLPGPLPHFIWSALPTSISTTASDTIHRYSAPSIHLPTDTQVSLIYRCCLRYFYYSACLATSTTYGLHYIHRNIVISATTSDTIEVAAFNTARTVLQQRLETEAKRGLQSPQTTDLTPAPPHL